jgi:hypothetical protein
MSEVTIPQVAENPAPVAAAVDAAQPQQAAGITPSPLSAAPPANPAVIEAPQQQSERAPLEAQAPVPLPEEMKQDPKPAQHEDGEEDANVAEALRLTARLKELKRLKKLDKKKGKASASASPKKLSAKALGAFVESRTTREHSSNFLLFEEECCQVLNDTGDIRYHGCVLKTKIGPFEAGARVKSIDWLNSANLLILNDTGKPADAIVVPIRPVELESATPCALP